MSTGGGGAGSGGCIELEHLSALTPPAAAPSRPAPAGLSDEDERLREELVAALEAHHGNVAAVARTLGKAPVQIRRWLQRFALDVHLYRR